MEEPKEITLEELMAEGVLAAKTQAILPGMVPEEMKQTILELRALGLAYPAIKELLYKKWNKVPGLTTIGCICREATNAPPTAGQSIWMASGLPPRRP